jgi:hypothetical protein
MHELIPNAKLIHLVRDSIERALSHYIHNEAAHFGIGGGGILSR